MRALDNILLQRIRSAVCNQPEGRAKTTICRSESQNYRVRFRFNACAHGALHGALSRTQIVTFFLFFAHSSPLVRLFIESVKRL